MCLCGNYFFSVVKLSTKLVSKRLVMRARRLSTQLWSMVISSKLLMHASALSSLRGRREVHFARHQRLVILG